MAPYKLYQEPIQKYRELNTTDWTPTFTIQTNPTSLLENWNSAKVDIKDNFR